MYKVWGPGGPGGSDFFSLVKLPCLISVCSVVPQEERPARSEGASAESRVQAEQDPLVHHHDGLQPQLLFCGEGCVTQWAEGSAAQKHHTAQVEQEGHNVKDCQYKSSYHLIKAFPGFSFFSELSVMVHLVKSMKDKFWGCAVTTVQCRWP